MIPSVRPLESRLARIVGGVVAGAVSDARAEGVALLDEDSPEADLVRDWCQRALGTGRVLVLPLPLPDRVDPCLQELGALLGTAGGAATPDELRRELGRLLLRIEARRRALLTAGTANKTALVLSVEPSNESLLPLGDLWASQVSDLAGGWSAPPEVRALAEEAGGIEALDRTLARWVDARVPLERALDELRPSARAGLAEMIERARFARRRSGLVPKLGGRTAGIDLFA